VDLYWLATHGQPVPMKAWPALLWIRDLLEKEAAAT